MCRLLKCVANKFGGGGGGGGGVHAVSLRNLGTKIRSQASKKTTPKQPREKRKLRPAKQRWWC